MNSKQAYDIFIALDGPVLDGMCGACGIMKLRYYEDDTYDQPEIKFYDGAAGGHAVQISSNRNIGHVGGFTRKSVFFDTGSLEPKLYMDTTDRNYRLREHWNSPTHVIFSENSEYIDGDFAVAIRGSLYQLSFADLKNFDATRLVANPDKKLIGHLGLPIPHALKISASGRYIFYGAMDRLDEFAKKVGIFDLKEKTHRIINLDETAWHIQPHPTDDCFYAVSECYDLQKEDGDNTFGFRRTNNYAWKIWPDKRVDKHVLPAFVHSHLSSDIVVMNSHGDVILYNSCASSTITIARMSDGRVWHIDEKARWWENPRAQWCNLVESLSRVSFPNNLHKIIKAMRISRCSLLDGSYGLVKLDFGDDKQRLISAHRGLNELIVYSIDDSLWDEESEMPIIQRIKLPPAYKYLPWKLGMPKDPRLGLHHCTAIKVS